MQGKKTGSPAGGKAPGAKKESGKRGAKAVAASAVAARTVDKTPAARKTCVLVLGMHRSGTSALARSISMLGAALPTRLVGAAPGNEAGHWEPAALVDYHDGLLADLHSAWHDWRPLDLAQRSKAELEGISGKIGQILAKDFGTEPLIIVKEPRTARFADFFISAVEAAGYDVRIVVALRNPLDVMDSLVARSIFWPKGFDRFDAALLWLSHMLGAERAARAYPHAVVSFEALAEQPVAVIDRVVRSLGLKTPASVSEMAAEIAGFVDPGHRHHARRPDEAQIDPQVAGWVADAYAALRVLEAERDVRAARAALDRIAAEFGRAMPYLDRVVESRNKALAEAEAQRRETLFLAEREEAERTARLAESDRAAGLETALGHTARDLDATRAWVEDLQVKLHRMEQDFRGSLSWRVTRPLRGAGGAARALRRLPRAAVASVRLGGGILPTIGRTLRVVRQEGIRGIRERMGIALRSAPPAPGGAKTGTRSAPAPDGYVGQILANARRDPAQGAEYVSKAALPADVSASPIKTIAFYLPQFHPIPENDAWWGTGFTEWTNVTKAAPQFAGHYQPHLPGELGFYDLRLVDVQRQQAELARHYGVHGFCYHHYWFAGRRLLERPFNQILANPQIDLPFCLCWANENWTRRWDGMEDDILIGQNHTPEDDLAFIADIAPAMRDPRYIRHDGRPILIVYRVTQLPDARATAERWRDYCRREGIGELYLVAARSFGITDPRPYGFDAAIEFPPHNAGRVDITDHISLANPDFSGIVYDFEGMATSYTDTGRDYPLIKTVSPGWDNEARKPGKGHIFHGATPAAYGAWLRRACRMTQDAMAANPEQPPFVFVNAWNEWAEGAHLEPDRRFGYGYLQETADVLGSLATVDGGGTHPGRIAVVSHDAHPHGAQYLALNLCRTLAGRFGKTVDCVLLGPGPLAPEFAAAARRVHDLAGRAPDGAEAKALAARLRDDGIGVAICNTTVSGPFAATLAQAGIRVVGLVHELPGVIASLGLGDSAAALAGAADRIVFAAPVVRDSFAELTGLAAEKAVLRPQGAYKRNSLRAGFGPGSTPYRALRARLGLAAGARIVLGVGFADRRKGFDLFVEAAERLARRDDTVFVWIGHHDLRLQSGLAGRVGQLKADKRLVLPGRMTDTDDFYAGADVLALTSREDPYPSVVLEALDVGLPVAGFAGATGTDGLIADCGGRLVPAEDAGALAAALAGLAEGATAAARLERARAFWRRPEISFPAYVHDLLDLAGTGPKRVSAVVPNFNYARFLPARIDSILNQTYPVSELVILDDASTDDSRAVIDALLPRIDIPVNIILNDRNSGSVFRQWQKGAEAATGECLWIAEADDLAEPDFLSRTMAAMRQDEIVLSYAQSRQMAQDGRILADTYLDYVADISPARWKADYIRPGTAEIAEGLSVKNTIPNVSAVVFRRAALVRTMREHIDEILSYRVAGDWCVYAHLLTRGGCAYTATPLNSHRRHDESVTLRRFGWPELEEIERMQATAARLADTTRLAATAAAYVETLIRQFNLKR